MNSTEHDDLVYIYPKLSKIGYDMLYICKQIGVYSSEDGKKLLQKIEDYFNGQDIEDKELASNAQRWYEGTFSKGYYMNDNDSTFAEYLKSKTVMRIYN
jgi:hypothetical protein